MKKSPYLPKGDKERRTWINNFDTQITSIGPLLGISASEIDSIHDDTKVVNYLLDNLEVFKAETQERTRYKDILFDGDIGIPVGDLPDMPVLAAPPSAVPAGIFKRVAKIVQRMKNHPNYNEALGKSLGIIGSEKQIDVDNAMVAINVRRNASDGVALDFIKGPFDGVIVYAGTYSPKSTTIADSVANSEEPVLIWTEIGRAGISPFVDNRPNGTSKPETRYYRMRYHKKEIPVGKDSNTISVNANITKAGNDLATKVK